MKKPKRLLVAAGGVALFAIAIFVIGQNMHKQTSAGTLTLPAVTRSTPTPQPAPAPPVLPPAAKTAAPARKPHVSDAVTAAALAMSNLSQAQFLPAEQIRQVVSATVVPAERPTLEQQYAAAGKVFATNYLGYASVNDARLRASYSVTTQKYRVAFFGKSEATIWLYTVSHWITIRNLEYYTPSLTVVQMRWINGRWMYAGAHNPPASMQPSPEANLQYEQTVQRFKPYLKGFKPYESS